MFKTCIRFAGVIISLELLAQTKEQGLDGSLLRDSGSRLARKEAVKRLIDISARRVQHGELNVKMHMFLSVVLAEVESMESGTECEDVIARGAVASLDYCHDLLQKQLGSPAQRDFSIPSGEPESDWLDFDMELFLQDGL